MVKIVCLGNEFIEGDSLAKEIGKLLSGDFDIVNVKDSFELMEIVGAGEDFVILDVVRGLDSVRFLEISDLRVDSILSTHDFDAGFVLGLLDEKARIIGIPMVGDVKKIKEEVLKLL